MSPVGSQQADELPAGHEASPLTWLDSEPTVGAQSSPPSVLEVEQLGGDTATLTTLTPTTPSVWDKPRELLSAELGVPSPQPGSCTDGPRRRVPPGRAPPRCPVPPLLPSGGPSQPLDRRSACQPPTRFCDCCPPCRL